MKKLKKFLKAQVVVILLAAVGLAYASNMLELKLGLDLKGGTQLDYQLDLSEVPESDRESIIEGVQEVIRRRVDSLGVAEPNIYSSNIANEYHVIVELAGIDNIEEARDIVGKTIQLEFKTENSEPNDDKVEAANKNAEEFLLSIQSGADFDILAREKMDELQEDVIYTKTESVALDVFAPVIQDLIKDKNVGDIVGPTQVDESYVLDVNNEIRLSNGLVIIEITDKSTEEVEEEIKESVSARHILIASKETDENLERSDEEALALATELRERILAGESLADLAPEFSDDKGSGEKGGDLGSFERGRMVSEFEEAAFALEPGEISDVIKSPFGYHIIEVYDKTQSSTETKTIDKYAINKITFNTSPNPWSEEAAITGENFERADVYLNDAYQPYVSITFDSEGAKLFEKLTEENIGKRIAIFVGGQLISAPTVENKISGGTAQINGNYTLEQAQELARDLNTGAIPAPIELVGQYTISASLGSEALNESIFAGLLGLLILGVYMLLYYRLPGLLASLALTIYSILIIFLIKSTLPVWLSLLISMSIFIYLIHLLIKNDDSGGEKFLTFILSCIVLFFISFVLSNPITLTLAGVAGVILSIGMAVDANVLIFERMKEELREGASLQDAIEKGFKRAWDSIRDSNFSSLITCAILFYFGSSIIRGFALNLALGILISMFSAIILTRTLLRFTSETKLEKYLFLWTGKKKTSRSIEIIKKSKIWAGISGSLVILSVLSTLIFGLNLGLDFTGGAMMEVSFTKTEEEASNSQEFSVEDLQMSLQDIDLQEDLGSLSIVKTDQKSFLIRSRDLNEDEHDAILSELGGDIAPVNEIRFTSVGPTIGATLKQKALIALGITLIMIVLYIAFAFRKIPKEVSPWRFGICAIAALVHDIVIIIGIFVLLGRFAGVELDALFITALLTIMGFSVHDTIVVFDRVRENLKFRKSADTLADSANKALNETMARSLNTSISTLITILALLIWGANSTFWFVLALAAGIVVGTYSSIFVASPLLVWWNDRANK